MRGYRVKSFSKAFPLTTRKQIYEKIHLKNTWQVMSRIAIAHYWPSSQEEKQQKLVPFHLQAGCNAIEKTMIFFSLAMLAEP